MKIKTHLMRKSIEVVGVLFLGLSLIFVRPGEAASPRAGIDAGNALYRKGDYPAALEKYQEALNKAPEEPVVNYDAGTAAYQTGDFKKAMGLLEKALLSEDKHLRAKSYYNVANAAYRYGMAQEDKDINTAVTSVEQSLSYYQEAMNLNDKDSDAPYNYKIATEELVRRKKKKQEQDEQKKQQQNQQKQKDQQQEEKKESSEKKQEQNSSKPEEQKPQDVPQPKEEQKPEEKKGQQEEQQNKEEGQQGKEIPQPENSEDKSQQPKPASSDEMTPQEREMLIDQYQRQEEPKGLLNFMKHKGKEYPVTKDW